jgi:hypothetical protein
MTDIINWGRSAPCNRGAAVQLARLHVETPRDVTIYLYGYRDKNGREQDGYYVVAWGAGGSARSEIVHVPSRGIAMHVVADTVSVDAPPFPTGSGETLARASVGLGAPSLWKRYGRITGFGDVLDDDFAVVIPAFTTLVRIVGVFTRVMLPPAVSTKVTGTTVAVWSSSVVGTVISPGPPVVTTHLDMTTGDGMNLPVAGGTLGLYAVDDLTEGRIPLYPKSGFFSVFGPAATNADLFYEFEGYS